MKLALQVQENIKISVVFEIVILTPFLYPFENHDQKHDFERHCLLWMNEVTFHWRIKDENDWHNIQEDINKNNLKKGKRYFWKSFQKDLIFFSIFYNMLRFNRKEILKGFSDINENTEEGRLLLTLWRRIQVFHNNE